MATPFLFGWVTEFQPDTESIETYEERIKVFFYSKPDTRGETSGSTAECHRISTFLIIIQSIGTRQARRRVGGGTADST